MDGVLLVNKPAGITSHDVVAAVRRASGVKRIGHTGTLDPMATGLLILCIGKATRIVEYLTGVDKTYIASLTLGQTTDTQDSSGEILSTLDASGVTEETLTAACNEFVGKLKQIPPMVSAIKRDGKPLYWYARKGETLEREAREIDILDIKLHKFIPGGRAGAEIEVDCSSGTYIRTLCADIGERLGCGGLMSSLHRTRIGSFSIQDSYPLDEIKERAECKGLIDILLSINDALSSMPTVTINMPDSERFCNGMAAAAGCEGMAAASVRVLDERGGLLGIGVLRQTEDGCVVAPHKVLAERSEVMAA